MGWREGVARGSQSGKKEAHVTLITINNLTTTTTKN